MKKMVFPTFFISFHYSLLACHYSLVINHLLLFFCIFAPNFFYPYEKTCCLLYLGLQAKFC